MIRVSPHARKRIIQKNISTEDILNTLNSGEEAYENISQGKEGSRMDFGDKYLVVIWRYDNGDKEVITVYWRNKKSQKHRFIE